MSSSVGDEGKSPARGARGPAGVCRPAPPPPAAARAAGPAAAEELHGVGDDLGRLALVAVLLPLAPLEAAVDGHGPSLRQVLGTVLRLLAEDAHREVVRLVRPLSRRVLAARVDRDAEGADRRAARRVTQLRVPGEVPDDNDSVDGSCHLLVLLKGVRGIGLDM